MILNSHNIEFGYELISILPYAYHLHKAGILDETISGIDTKCLYYFSKKHTENKEKRSFYNNKFVTAKNINIHRADLDLKEWCPPPLAEKYKSEIDERLVIICNRYNVEWGVRPINFFSLEDLRKIFTLLKDFKIIYIHFQNLTKYHDNAEMLNLGDYEMIKKEFPDVQILQEINTTKTINELQLELFGKCRKFITMNGGHSILASYFGGENIIYSKYGSPQAKELYPQINSFYRWYHLFNKSRIDHVESINKLLERIKFQWVENNPVINILIRTSYRPQEFAKCLDSINKQTYKNIRVLVSYDNEKANNYLQPLKVQQIKVEKNNSIIRTRLNEKEYGLPFTPNLYLNELQSYVNSGYIMYLDDDDELIEKNVIQKIVNEINKGNDFVYWKVKVGGMIVPRNEKQITPCDVSGIGVCFKHELKEMWEAYRLGDYRVISKIFNKTKNISFINEVLTKTQKGLNFGKIKDKLQDNGLIETTEEMRNKIEITLKNGQKKIVSETVAKELERKGLTMKIKVTKDVIPELKKDTIVDVTQREANFYIKKNIAELVDEDETKEKDEEKEIKTEQITKEYKKRGRTKKVKDNE